MDPPQFPSVYITATNNIIMDICLWEWVGSLTLAPAIGTLFSCGVVMSNFNMIIFASSYILFCHIWLFSFECLLFSNEKQKENRSRGIGRWWGTRRRGVEGKESLSRTYCIGKNIFSVKEIDIVAPSIIFKLSC